MLQSNKLSYILGQLSLHSGSNFYKENKMFNPEMMIDSVQNGKKQFVKTFITDEKIAGALNSFIDNQTNYTKAAAKATMDATSTVIRESLNHMAEAAKFDYNKFGEGIMKAYMSKSA